MKNFRLTVILLMAAAFVMTPIYVNVQLKEMRWFTKGKNAKDHEKAIDCFTKAIKIDPNFAWAYCHRGLTYRVIGENDKARADFIKACNGGHNAACND